MTWLRLDDSAVLNPKLGNLTSEERWALIALWSYCARRKNEGKFKEDELQHALWASQKGPKSVTKAQLNTFQKHGLITRKGKNGTVWQVKDWAQYQPKDPTGADRMRAYRERNASRNTSRNETVTTSRPVPSPSFKELPPNPRKRGNRRDPQERQVQKFQDHLNGHEVATWDDLSEAARYEVVQTYAKVTGLRHIRGTHGAAWKVDPLGTDPVPRGYNADEIPAGFSGKPTPQAFLTAYLGIA